MKIKIVKNKNYDELRPLYDNFEVSEKADICLAVGGDGAFARAAQEFDGPILPVRSGEKGSIGYYSDVSLEDMDLIIKSLKRRSYAIEKLGNKIHIMFKGRSYFAVNEALLHNVLQEVSFKIYELNGKAREEIYPYIMSGDGILITGVIGSTAYNKSAGGPIIMSPNVICLTFLNVDGPYKNPIVIDSTKTVEVEVVKYSGVLIHDGIRIAALKPGDKFNVSISNKELKIIRLKGMGEPLAKKLDRLINSRMVK